MRRLFLLTLVVSMIALSTTSASAQESPWRVSVSGGLVDFDLSGTGKTIGTAARVERAITDRLSVEFGSLLARPSEDFATTTLFAPEGLVRFALIDARVSPFVGGGGGFVTRHSNGNTIWDPSIVGTAGVRIRLTGETSVQGEMRLRGIGSNMSGSSAEWTAGLVWRPSRL